jgi:hypothetical protein
MLVFLLEMFQLDHSAKDPLQPPVQLACTLDGADISKFVSHVTAGIKILDPCAIDPISHLPIGLEGSKKVQSEDLCVSLQNASHPRCEDFVQRAFQGFL